MIVQMIAVIATAATAEIARATMSPRRKMGYLQDRFKDVRVSSCATY